jgi:hypothetical protein
MLSAKQKRIILGKKLKSSITISYLSHNKNSYLIEKYIAQENGETLNNIGSKVGYEIRIKNAKLEKVYQASLSYYIFLRICMMYMYLDVQFQSYAYIPGKMREWKLIICYFF